MITGISITICSHTIITVILPSKFQGIQLRPGERIVIDAPGGGGLGPPKERDPARVLEDVTNGFISMEQAGAVYGVLIDEKNVCAIRVK